MLKLIDLDASIKYGSIAGVKLSSACVPPEIARLIWRFQVETERQPWDDWPAWEQWVCGLPGSDQVLGSPTFDVWSFGVALYRLCVEDGVSLFLSSQADNIVEAADLKDLAFRWDSIKLDKLKKVKWPAAHDLILWCLEADATRRPQSFAEVLSHPFLGGGGDLHFTHGSMVVFYSPTKRAEPCLTKLWYGGATLQRAKDLHLAAEHGDPADVSTALARGGINADIKINSSTRVTPLHRAARKGHVDVFRLLIKDGADINATTKFGYTCLHWAVVHGQVDIVQEVLTATKIDTALQNDRGKTAWDLADTTDMARPFERAAAEEDIANAEQAHLLRDVHPGPEQALDVPLPLRHHQAAVRQSG